MEAILSEEILIQRLIQDVQNSPKKKVVFIAGHFPIFYNQQAAFEAINAWGEFSEYSLELACKIAKKLKDKEIRFAFIADDINYENYSSNAQIHREKKSRFRNKLYCSRSSSQATLPQVYTTILQSQGYDHSYVLRHNHGKKGRDNCLFFSERILRVQRQDLKDECSKAYLGFLENPVYFDKQSTYLVAFIPDRCTSNICNGVLTNNIQGISSSHVFMQTDQIFLNTANRQSLWQDGVMYRKD